MIFYKKSYLETTIRILLYISLFAMIIMVADGTQLGTDLDWKKQKCQAPWEKARPDFKHFHSKPRLPCYQK